MDAPVHNAPPAEGLQVPDHIHKDEDVAVALLRLAADDLAAARRELTGNGAREAGIHSVRQRLKRVRTVLRVFEAGPGEKARAARRSLTAIARMLAGARDADAAAASARELAAATPRAAALGFNRIVAMLEQEAARTHREETPLAEADRLLHRLALDVVALAGEPLDGRALLDEGFERAYRRGRRWMRQAHVSLATADLHNWRKNAKDLWHLLWLAQKRISRAGQQLEPVLERLSTLLGLDHDHAVLAEKLALSPTGDLALMAQLALIADRRRELEAEAFELGAGIYGRTPGLFVRSLLLR
jgi:CHAD domain-containing protein